MGKRLISSGSMACIIVGIFFGFTHVSHGKPENSSRVEKSLKVESPQNKGNLVVENKVSMRDLSWTEIHEMAKTLSDSLPKREWKGILAITRGGLIPAGILSHILGIRRIEVLNAVSYQGKKSGKIEFLNNE